jgi:hypothetical protein
VFLLRHAGDLTKFRFNTSSMEQVDAIDIVDIGEEMSKLLTRYAPQTQIKVRERPARHQLCPTLATASAATMTVPAPTRFTRKQRAVDINLQNQTRNSCPQKFHVDEKERPSKYDAPYDSVLFQLMESETLNIHDVKAYTLSRDSSNSS